MSDLKRTIVEYGLQLRERLHTDNLRANNSEAKRKACYFYWSYPETKSLE